MTGLASVAANTHVQTLEVLEVIAETADAVSVVLAVPDSLVHKFRYLPGQFLTGVTHGKPGRTTLFYYRSVAQVWKSQRGQIQ